MAAINQNINDMSTFKIYSTKDNNAKDLGIRNKLNFRIILILLPLIGIIIELTSKIFHYQLNTTFWIIYIVLILIVIGYSLILINRLKQIGIISFYENNITKKIGDLSEQWDYNSIKGFFIDTHIRDLFFQKNKLGIRTHFLEVYFDNNKSQRLVVSSISIDKPEYSLGKTLTSLSQLKKIELKGEIIK